MKTSFTILFILSFLSMDIAAQIGRLPLSPHTTIEQKIGKTDITIIYSRPSMRGREIFGDLVPYDKLWRTGANRNTKIEFSEDVVIGGAEVKKGSYAIFSIPSPTEWELVFYNETTHWEVPKDFDESKVVARVKVKVEQLAQPKEVLSIIIGDFTNYEFDLDFSWSDVRVSVPIELTTKKIMDDKIERILGGPGYADYYSAAEYEMESGRNYDMGYKYITKAKELTDEVTWWDLRLEAILLMKMGENDKAREVAKKGLVMATGSERQYGIDAFNMVLKKVGE